LIRKTLLISVRNLKKYFPIGGGLFTKAKSHVHAVDGVDLDIRDVKRWVWLAKAAAAKRQSVVLRSSFSRKQAARFISEAKISTNTTLIRRRNFGSMRS
jgi:ABC-type microcin C transport system duplicated ATPase subunit YejF